MSWRPDGADGAADRHDLRAKVAAALDDAQAESMTFTLVQVWGRVPGVAHAGMDA